MHLSEFYFKPKAPSFLSILQINTTIRGVDTINICKNLNTHAYIIINLNKGHISVEGWELDSVSLNIIHTHFNKQLFLFIFTNIVDHV